MKKYYLLIALLFLNLGLLFYLKFTAWPEMTLWPYLITKGWLPYRDIAIAHTPLMISVLALIYKIFGVGIIQLKIFTWILILSLDIFVYWISNKFESSKIALIALSSFIFWQLFFDGNGLWFDLFMGLFTLMAYYFTQNKKYFLTGLFWALAFISKQTAVWFLIPIGFWLIQNPGSKLKDSIKVVGGMVSVIIPFILIMWGIGVLPSFYNWAIKFGIFILPKAQGQVQLPDLKNLVISVFPFLIFTSLIIRTGKRNLNLLIWTIAGTLGAYPRFEYFHFQPAIPFLAIATGIVFSDIKKFKGILKIFIILYILGSLYLFAGFFMRNFGEGVRFYEKDVQDIVSYVILNTKPTDKIFVMNWWDNIYSLSDRFPAVDPWVPQLSWYMEIPGIQEKMVSNLELSKPKMILLNEYSESGLSAYIPKKVYDYVIANYKLKEKVDNIEILIPNK